MRASTRCARFTPERHTAQAASSGAGRPRSYLRGDGGMGWEGGEMAAHTERQGAVLGWSLKGDAEANGDGRQEEAAQVGDVYVRPTWESGREGRRQVEAGREVGAQAKAAAGLLQIQVHHLFSCLTIGQSPCLCRWRPAERRRRRCRQHRRWTRCRWRTLW